MKNLVTPIININGTSGLELLSQTRSIMSALSETKMAIRNAMPNGRDFYTQGSDVLTNARTAFYERLETIEDMRKDFEALAISINKQIKDARQ